MIKLKFNIVIFQKITMISEIEKAVEKHLVQGLVAHVCKEFDIDETAVRKIITGCINPPKEIETKTRIGKLKTECRKKSLTIPVKQQELHLSRFRGEWVIQGTKFIVKGPCEKIIIGKLINGKRQALNQHDKDLCKQNKWVFV